MTIKHQLSRLLLILSILLISSVSSAMDLDEIQEQLNAVDEQSTALDYCMSEDERNKWPCSEALEAAKLDRELTKEIEASKRGGK